MFRIDVELCNLCGAFTILQQPPAVYPIAVGRSLLRLVNNKQLPSGGSNTAQITLPDSGALAKRVHPAPLVSVTNHRADKTAKSGVEIDCADIDPVPPVTGERLG